MENPEKAEVKEPVKEEQVQATPEQATPAVSPEVEERRKEIERILLHGNKKDFHDRKNFGFLRKLLPKVLAEVDPATGVAARRNKGTSFFDPVAKKPVRPGQSVWTVQGYDLGLDNISSEALVLAAENQAIRKLVSPNEISNTKFVGGGNLSKKSLSALAGLKAKLESAPKSKPKPQHKDKPNKKKASAKPKVEKPKAQVIVPKAAED